MLTCSGVKQDLDLVTVNPAVENILSVGVHLIGMVLYLLATRELEEKSVLVFFLPS